MFYFDAVLLIEIFSCLFSKCRFTLDVFTAKCSTSGSVSILSAAQGPLGMKQALVFVNAYSTYVNINASCLFNLSLTSLSNL